MRYQVGGSLHTNDPTYVIRQADEQLYASLKAGDFCYVLNSRQMGKSSLLQRTSHRLKQEGHKCIYLDVTRLGSDDTTAEKWYKGIIISLFYSLNLGENVNLQQWWEMQAGLSPVQKLHQFVEEVLLANLIHSNSASEGKIDEQNDQVKRIFIFLDEIDSLLSLKFPVNDFFAWIRHCYNQQAHNPKFQHLGFALFGVASPSDLIADKTRTPFNIGKAIELHGFQLHEATPLLRGLEGIVNQPEAVLREIISWTGGQPFLTQKLCQLIVKTALDISTQTIYPPPETEISWIEELLHKAKLSLLVESQIIQHWESKDEPEHFRTIRNRLLFNEQRAGRLLGLYQHILQAEATEFFIPIGDSQEQTELLLSGLVEKRNGYLRVKNPIYLRIFNLDWVIRQLDNLRPYSQAFNAWVVSRYQDESRLLRGHALQEVLDWTGHKSLSDLDYRFLAASQELESREVQQKLKAERLKEIEARLSSEQKNARRIKWLLLGMTIKFLVASVLGCILFYQYQQGLSSEVKAIASAANGSFKSRQHLNALVQAIQARLKFQQLHLGNKNPLDIQTTQALEQAVYGADEFNRLSGHQGIVLGVDFSPDGKLIASSSGDRTVKLWQRDGTLVRTITHTTTLQSVRFSPDSRLIAVAGIDGIVRLWTIDGRLLTIFKGHKSAVWRVAFSPDGQILASASGDFSVKLWRLDGSLIRTLKHERGVWGIAFSPDGQILASAMVGGTNKLWRLDGTLIKTFTAGKPTIWSLAFSPDGQTFVSGGADNVVRLWSRDGILLRTFQGHTSEVLSVAFSSDGQMITSAGADKTIKLWRVDGTLIRTFQGHGSNIQTIAFSADRQIIASAGHDNTIRLWRVNPPLTKLLNGHHEMVWRAAFSPNGQILASVAGKDIKIWRRDGSLVKTITQEDSRMLSLSFSPDGQTLAVVGSGGAVRLWQLETNKRTILKGNGIGLLAITYSPDGKWLATVGFDGKLRLWQRNFNGQFQLHQIIPVHTARIWDIAYSPDGQFIASASGDGSVKLWKWGNEGGRRQEAEGRRSKDSTLTDLEPLNSRKERETDATVGVLNPCFIKSPAVTDSAALASLRSRSVSQRASRSLPPASCPLPPAFLNNKRLLEKPDKILAGHSSEVFGVAISPDSQFIASSSGDGRLRLWRRDGALVRIFDGKSLGLTRVAFSPNGETLAAAGFDNTIKIWKIDGTLLTTLNGHTSNVSTVAFSPDGKILASGGDDQLVILWDLQQILHLDLVKTGCDWVRDYLHTNTAIEKTNRSICKF